ncbi:unnamed protein product [Fusarium graminearum]|nr:unnamed protein product [Fusarium graminearum]CAG1984428.1 unnamed protein product [Fusarium graminearum]VTO89573.1 unnamed protein product [Fusarium graminearum]
MEGNQFGWKSSAKKRLTTKGQTNEEQGRSIMERAPAVGNKALKRLTREAQEALLLLYSLLQRLFTAFLVTASVSC